MSSIGEGTSGFNVRGGNIDQNLILLDEAPLYNASHLWGFFSAFNADAIKNMILYKGNFPARFGGRASSVLDIRQREGNNQVFQGQGGIGIIFSRLTLEGPLQKDKISFLVSGRRSFIDLIPKSITQMDQEKVYFYDLNTKLTWVINQKNRLFLSGYFGSDVLQFKFDEEQNSDDNSTEQIDFSWVNATSTLRWNHIFGDQLFLNLSGIYSNYNYGLDSNSSGSGPDVNNGIFDWHSNITTFVIKPDFTFYPSLGKIVRFGINTTYHQFLPAQITSKEKGLNSTKFQKEKGLEIATYFEYEKKWEKTTLLAGLRYSWFGNIGPYEVHYYDPTKPKQVNTVLRSETFDTGSTSKKYANLEPRLAIKHQINPNQQLKINMGRNMQYIHLLSNTTAPLPFDVWKPSGEHLKPLDVFQASIGYGIQHDSGRWEITTDLFYKSFDNIVEYKNGADLFINDRIETQLLPGTGKAYGIEITYNKKKGGWTGELNYTYSRSLRKTESSFPLENLNFGNLFPSNFDRPHILNLIVSQSLGRKWDANISFTFQSGRPITPVIGQFKLNDNWLLTYSERNAYRLPNIHRMDLSFSYSPNKFKINKKWKSSWDFGVYNLYAAKNPISRFSEINIASGQPTFKSYHFSVIGSLIPFLNYNFKF